MPLGVNVLVGGRTLVRVVSNRAAVFAPTLTTNVHSADSRKYARDVSFLCLKVEYISLAITNNQ